MPNPPVDLTRNQQDPNGQWRTWQPDTQKAKDSNAYLGLTEGMPGYQSEADYGPNEGPGSWVPASFDHPNGLNPWKLIGGLAAAGTGGQALASYGIPALASLFAPGGGAAAAPAFASSAAPGLTGGAMGGVTFAPAAAGGIGGGAAASTAGAAGGGGGILSSLFGGGGGALNGILGLGSGLLNGYSQGKQNDKQIALQQQQLAQQQKQFESSQAQNANQFNSNQAIGSTQLNPFTQMGDRQKQALLSTLVQNYQPAQYSNGHFTGGVNGITADMLKNIGAFFGPDAMQAQEGAFNATAGNASGGKFVAPAPGSVGYQSPGLLPSAGGASGGGASPSVLPDSASAEASQPGLMALITRLMGKS